MISVRVSKDGRWLICGKPDCGFRLGRIVNGGLTIDGKPMLHIRLPPVWKIDPDIRPLREDNRTVWVFKKRAMRNLEALRRRGVQFDAASCLSAPSKLWQQTVSRHKPGGFESKSNVAGHSSASFSEIICPHCGTQQGFDVPLGQVSGEIGIRSTLYEENA